MVAVQSQLDLLAGNVETLLDKNCVTADQLDTRINDIVVTVEKQNLQIEKWKAKYFELEVQEFKSSAKIADVVDQLNKARDELELLDRENRRFYLLFQGFKKKSRLERSTR